MGGMHSALFGSGTHVFHGETFGTTLEVDVSMNQGLANCTANQLSAVRGQHRRHHHPEPGCMSAGPSRHANGDSRQRRLPALHRCERRRLVHLLAVPGSEQRLAQTTQFWASDAATIAVTPRIERRHALHH
jgi:hypothetical protein